MKMKELLIFLDIKIISRITGSQRVFENCCVPFLCLRRIILSGCGCAKRVRDQWCVSTFWQIFV